jgi:hypothetical protein
MKQPTSTSGMVGYHHTTIPYHYHTTFHDVVVDDVCVMFLHKERGKKMNEVRHCVCPWYDKTDLYSLQ